MASVRPASWPLRVRVALAFLATTALAMMGLVLFVQARVADTLDERLQDSLEAEAGRLLALDPAARRTEVEALAGETFAQLVDEDGKVKASSPLVAGTLLPPDAAGDAARSEEPYVERGVRTYDDEADADRETETEPALLLVRRMDGQLLVVGTSREDAEEAVEEVRTQLLVGGPLALLLAGILGYVVAGAGLRPIERMRSRAATISTRSAGERLPIPTAEDELRRLALTLNAMLDRLDDGLQRERRFVAEASHELRTPLALLLTEIELALARPRPAEELVAALRSAEEETRRLISLAEDLLLLASADAGRLRIEPRTVDLADLAEQVVDRFRTAAGARPIRVTADGPVLVDADPERLDQVVSNLVDNALRHGAGAVDVTVSSSGPTVLLAVTDEGDGFAVPDPFDRFVGGHGGYGLGLSIVREVVRAHGGSVEAARDGGRTSLRVRLPGPTLGP